MSDDRPVTRAELREELERFATKQDLDTWGHAIIAHLKAYMDESVQRVTRVLAEQHTREVSIVDDKYQDLPARVSRLEAAVFPPKRTRRRT